MRKLKIIMIGFAFVAFLGSCSTIPKGAVAVDPFDVDRYLGQWYEIARFDFRFERGLNNTTANYSLNSDGSVKVVNRGYDYTENKWKEATGKAKQVSSGKAMLKVSFFGPFYAGYNVLALDDEYKYALVSGQNLDYLWILSRETTVPDDIKSDYLNLASKLGFDTSRLIWVEHNAQ
jgi:apolipoprotein D and lipocalin family protein